MNNKTFIDELVDLKCTYETKFATLEESIYDNLPEVLSVDFDSYDKSLTIWCTKPYLSQDFDFLWNIGVQKIFLKINVGVVLTKDTDGTT